MVEALSATNFLALEWPLPCVQPQVYLQAALGRKAFLAVRAFVGLLASVSLPPQMPNSVTSKVLSKVSRLPESLIATLDCAGEGSLTGVDSLVLGEVRRLRHSRR